MLAFLDIVVVAMLAILAWRGYRLVPRVFRPAIAAIVLILLQAILGGIVVKGALAPVLVTAHFATAMVLVAVLVDLLVAALTLDASPSGPIDGLTRLAVAVVAGTFALLLVGAYVRGENAGLVFGTWPLMDGRLVPELSSAPAALQLAHRLLAALVGTGVAALALSAWGARAIRSAVATLAIAAAGLYAAQVLIGAALVWTRRAPWAIVAHVAVSSLVWGALVAVATLARIGRRTAFEGTGERS
jgi:cytochrome c oxidase assembly protein subunit 15